MSRVVLSCPLPCVVHLAYQIMVGPKSVLRTPQRTAKAVATSPDPTLTESEGIRGRTEELGVGRGLRGASCKIFHLDNSFAVAMMRLPSLRARPWFVRLRRATFVL
jgi:hypothetical protein